MKMNEFGCENGKKILLIHGAGTSYKMWTAQIKILSGEYHLYVPTLNGHVIGENTELLSRQIIDCQYFVLNGYDHGELAIGNPDKHAEMLRMLMQNQMIA